MGNNISKQFKIINERVRELSATHHKDSKFVKLIVVTKWHTVEEIAEVIEAGAEDLGENYVDEAKIKYEKFMNKSFNLHMIGHLQSRKIRNLFPLFSYLHSIDRFEIGEKLSKYCLENSIKLNSLVEVNISGETTKTGFDVSTKELESKFVNDFGKIINNEGLVINGLMTMAPFPVIKTQNKGVYRTCAELLKRIQDKYQLERFVQLSMGTSADFEVAIAEGASMVRIGELIMGPRNKNNKELGK
jgi:pyridoxal phosphate enzyme (YggS family)